MREKLYKIMRWFGIIRSAFFIHNSGMTMAGVQSIPEYEYGIKEGAHLTFAEL